MFTPIQTVREVVLGKIQTALGVPAVPTAADNAILCEPPSIAYDGVIMPERTAAKPGHGNLKKDFVGALKVITFTSEIKGTLAAYSATVLPEIDPFLRMCSIGVTLDTTPGAETVTYSRVSTAQEYGTVYYYQDGLLHKLTDCQGDVALDHSVDGGNKLTFTLYGKYSPVTDVPLISPSYDNAIAPPFVNANVSVLGTAVAITKLTYGMNNTIAKPKSANSPNGYGDMVVTDGDINGSFDPLHNLIIDKDWYSEFENGTEGELTTGLIGSQQYNRFTVNFPKVYYSNLSDSDREGLRALEVPFTALETTTDDEFSLVFS